MWRAAAGWTAGMMLLSAGTAVGEELRHGVVFHKDGVFAAWPANGGAWTWDGGREAAVAFVTGRYELRAGHNVVPPYTNRLARTRDGGRTWAVEDPPGFFQTGDALKPLPAGGINFAMPGLALRVVAEGYQGGGPGGGALCVSTDRGRTWAGPYPLAAEVLRPLAGGRDQLTFRTDYVVQGARECLILGSARPADRSKPDLALAARLTDGGRSGTFLDWIPPAATAERVIMPSTVQLPGGRLVTAVRVRAVPRDENRIDAYASEDGGRQWVRLGKVADTGGSNGNPPSLVRLADGRLGCTYGDRSRRQMLARLSDDGAKSWGPEVVLREGCLRDAAGEVDFGYPRSFANPDGELVTVYYWADREYPQGCIAVTGWRPGAPKR